MKKIKRFSEFLNESLIDSSVVSRFASALFPSSSSSSSREEVISSPVKPGEKIIASEFSSSRNDEDMCKDNDCWTWFGKEEFWNGVNKINNKKVPKITIDKTPEYFDITYEGTPSGFLLKHKYGGKGDTIHQLLNVLTLELNDYLSQIYAKPVVQSIKMDLKGNKLYVRVPLEKVSGYHYEIHRRGGLGHGGDFSDLVKYETKKGYEEAIHKSGRLTEKFVTFIK